MAKFGSEAAHLLTHSDLTRPDQVVGMIWTAYPGEVDFDEALDLLEAAGLSKQNRARLRVTLKAGRQVSQGKARNSYRLNPRYVDQLTEKFAPIVGAPKKIRIDNSSALLPAGTLPLDRVYVAAIVQQVNEGYVAGHYDCVAVMLRRLAESLLIECYVRAHREAAIRVNGILQMLDGLISSFAADTTIGKSRHLIAQLRKIKELGDTAAHSRTYVTKRADIEDIKSDARHCLSEMAHLAGL